MRDRGPYPSAYRLASIGYWAAGVGAVVVSAALKADVQTVPAWASPAVTYVQASAWWMAPGLVPLAGFTRLLRQWLKPPKLWQVLHAVLDAYRDEFFKDLPGDPHDHRVTLFKRVPFWLRPWPWEGAPWSGWLVPVVRSGHTTQRTNSYFPAPDDPDQALGIAGKAWNGGIGAQVFTGALPRLDKRSPPKDIERYAELTGVPAKTVQRQVNRGKTLRLSMGGFPVEAGTAGEPWGVIVLDSLDETGVTEKTSEAYARMARDIGRILKGAGL